MQITLLKSLAKKVIYIKVGIAKLEGQESNIPNTTFGGSNTIIVHLMF